MSLSEVILIMLVALVVLGPQRIPKIIYTLTRYTQKIRQMAEQFKGEVESQLKQEQLLESQSRADEADARYRNSE